MNTHLKRNYFLTNSSDKLLTDCKLTYFKASGKGGQKRNKTSSAVRIHHLPTDIIVTNSSSRSQYENKEKAINKLYYQIALNLRSQDYMKIENVEMSLRNPQYYLWVAYCLDILFDIDFNIKGLAEKLNISPSKTLKLLYRDTILWQKINLERQNLGLRELRK